MDTGNGKTIDPPGAWEDCVTINQHGTQEKGLISRKVMTSVWETGDCFSSQAYEKVVFSRTDPLNQ